jgi:hypothetical protein
VRHRFLLGLSIAATLLACSDDDGITDPLPVVTPVALLKEIVVSGLPAPSYHFEYDAAYRVRGAALSAGTRRYEVTWQGDRITRLANTVGARDTLDYLYEGSGQVGVINYVDASGALYAIVTLTYDGARLARLERRVKLDGSFVTDRTMTFAYYDDGNLRDLVEQRPAITGVQTATTTTDHFERYDTGINVDGFALLHDESSDQLILLPGVQLQKSNPAREVFSGGGSDYTVDYSWTYDDRNRPLTRTGTLEFTSGPRTGEQVETRASYSYY